ncbi:MAG: hypothetical protein AAFO74_10475 [Pseudomonadota bacterium]
MASATTDLPASNPRSKRIFEQPPDGTILVLGISVMFGLGHGRNNPAMPLGPNKL